MYTAKHVSGKKTRVKRTKFALIAAVALILALAIGGTIAWLIDDTDEIINTFTAPKTGSELIDVVSGDVKTEVAVKNNSDYPVYARIAVIGNEINADGNVIGGYDVSNYLKGSGWELKGDGYYYWLTPIAKGGQTSDLVSTDIPLTGADGKLYQVTVMSEIIQAEPVTAIIEAWGVDPGSASN